MKKIQGMLFMAILLFVVLIPKTVALKMKNPEPGISDFSPEMDKQLILNGVWYGLNSGPFSLQDLAMSVMIYHFLGEEIPQKDDVIAYFNSFQNEDGSFGNTHGFGVIPQTFILKAYKILNSKPARSMDSWFDARASDWKTIVEDVKTYSPTNPWGTLVGYPLSYFVYYSAIPHWMENYFTNVKDNKQTWMTVTHQRDHVTVPYLVLNRSRPYLEELLITTLNEQQTNGSWFDEISETAMVIHNILLPFYLRLQTYDLAITISAARNFVLSCYHETVLDSTPIAGFCNNPTDKTTTFASNFFGIMAAIDTGLLEGNTDPLYEGWNPSR